MRRSFYVEYFSQQVQNIYFSLLGTCKEGFNVTSDLKYFLQKAGLEKANYKPSLKLLKICLITILF